MDIATLITQWLKVRLQAWNSSAAAWEDVGLDASTKALLVKLAYASGTDAAIFRLNQDQVGAPSENAGIEIERGTATDVRLYWDESADEWVFQDAGGRDIFRLAGSDLQKLTDTSGSRVYTIDSDGRYVADGSGRPSKLFETAGLGRNLLKNGNFEVWSNGASSDPDGWQHSGGTVSRTTGKLGSYAARLSPSGASQYISQSVPNSADFKGRVVTAVAWVKTSSAGSACIGINDGVGETRSSFHSGSGGWELLAVSRSIDSAATQVEFRFYPHYGGSTNAADVDGALLAEGAISQAFAPSVIDHLLFDDRFHCFAYCSNIFATFGTAWNGAVLRDAVTDDAALNWHAPADFDGLIEAEVIGLPDAGGNMVWNCYCDVAADGESWNIHQGNMGGNQTRAVSFNTQFRVSVKGAFPSVMAAGDAVGIKFRRFGGDAADTVNTIVTVMGLRIKYRRKSQT